MESSPAAPSARATQLARALSLLIMFLMVIAAVYGTTMAMRYFRQIGV